MSDGILDDDLVAAVVGDGVVEQLGRSGIQFLVVFTGDLGGHLLEHLAGLSVQILAGDLKLFAHVRRGDALGEFAGGLVVIFRDLAMAVLMFDHMLGCAGRHPDVDVKLQRDLDLRDGDGRVCGIRLSRLPADTGAGQELGIALRAFPRGQGGISAGVAAGSNVRLAKATGCLSIIGTGASPSGRRDEKPRHASQPKRSTPSNTQNTIKPREGNTASAFHFAKKTERETGVYGWRMTRKVLSSSVWTDSR